ncbi:MAG: methylated-DNA--[protein]-cysteine S-methyltransferase [Clostridia bacterium]|nr:methylated-DNA--[protein]-cysteine S-methyltransferase [Clostridia bacterium]
MYYSIWHTEFGWMGALGDEQGLAYIVLPKSAEAEVFEILKRHATTDRLEEKPSLFADLIREINCYFQGAAFDFTRFKLQWQLVTPYRQKVLRKAMEIPYGETRTYKWLAEAVGNPKGSRSVGQAMANNPWPIVVPCHRVIGTGGKLTGFGGGLALKERLLALEAGQSK